MSVETRLQYSHRRRICRGMLKRLPDWFGRPEAIEIYAENSATLPMLIALAGRELVGFLSLQYKAGKRAEILVMAVRRDWHRQGIGRLLVSEAAALAVRRGAVCLRVRTLCPSHPDPFYQQTRAFYRACGFRPIGEVIDDWGPGTPSLLLAADLHSGQLVPDIGSGAPPSSC